MLTIHELEPTEMPDFEIHLPAIRGIQAGRPFFIALCPTKFIPRLIPLESKMKGRKVEKRGKEKGEVKEKGRR